MAEARTFARLGARLLVPLLLGVIALPLDAAQPSSSPVAETALAPVSLGVAIDEAGIGASDLSRARALVLAVFDALPAGSEVMVASFSGEQRILQPATTDRARIGAALESFKAGEPGVALPDGLFDMVDYIAKRQATVRAMLLVSAGRVREGDLQFEDPLNAATLREVRIHTLGVGQGDGKLLRRIAKITFGEYVRLEVADPPTLARSLTTKPDLSSPDPSAEDEPETSPSPVETRGSAGLLGAAAVFFSLGGLLLLGIVVLLIRRMNRKVEPSAPVGGPVSMRPRSVEASARSLPQANLQLGTGITNVEAANLSGSFELPRTLTDGEALIEKTMVVNTSPTLRALSGPGAGRNFPLSASGSTAIGRSRRNEIVVPEDAASALHCRIDREGDSFVILDLKSTNGTWVNGARVERAVLQHGDKVKVGETIFAVSLFGERN